jgi:hypothetical protein
MKSNKPTKGLSLTVACCFVLAVFGHTVALNKHGSLHLIKKIYIEVTPNVAEDRDIAPILKSELERRGFTVVGSAEAADAILTGENTAEVVLDGDGSTPHKAIYRYQLALPSKEVLWKARVKFTTVLNFAQDNERAARKLAEKLLSDWQKSAKNAAHNQRTMPNNGMQRTRN